MRSLHAFQLSLTTLALAAASVVLAPTGAASAAPAVTAVEAEAPTGPTTSCVDQTEVCAIEIRPPSGQHGNNKSSPRANRFTIPSGYPFYTLQLNLCNSGKAPCYNAVNRGRSIGEAYQVILDQFPDVVTLNEICENDLNTLWPAMQQNYPGSYTFTAFSPVSEGATVPPPDRCAARTASDTASGLSARSSRRTGCFGGAGGRSEVGTSPRTALRRSGPSSARPRSATTTRAPRPSSSSNSTVAMNQCKALMNTVIPSVRSQVGIDSPVRPRRRLQPAFRRLPRAAQHAGLRPVGLLPQG